jgi:hypothetical protein
MHYLLEVTLGNPQVAVASEDDLALLGDLEDRPGRGRGSRQDRPPHRAATAPHRATPTVKDGQLDTCG